VSVVTDKQGILVSLLCERIGLTPSPDIRCLGTVNSDGEIAGIVGYDGYNGASVVMHVAGFGNWINRDILKAAFDYPFRVMDCKVVLGLVPSGNVEAIRLNKHLGFKVINEIEDAHPDGSLILMAMRREECRWLKLLPPNTLKKMH
jgi:RimJ/RimL family protein N-acetyltransferase